MAISRDSLTSLDGFETGVDLGATIARANGRVVQWIAGGSFLAGHLAVFGTALLVAFAWNVARTPMDLSALEPFRMWSILVVAHLLLTGGYQLATRLLGWNNPTWTATVADSSRTRQRVERQPVPALVWSRGVESASRMNSTARRWATASGRGSSGRLATPDDQAWPEQPAIVRADSGEDLGGVTWPETAPRSTTLSANPADHVVSIDHVGAPTQDSTQTWLEGFVESRSKEKEQRWSWVEAAAASWLSRRDTPVPPQSQSSETPGTDSVQPEPEVDSRPPA